MVADVATLVPHRYPFLFIDTILSASEQTIVGMKTYDEAFLFVQVCPDGRKLVPGVILLESIIQCGGAGATQLGLVNRQRWGLASLQKVRFLDAVPVGATVSMSVSNVKVSNKLLKQTGRAQVDGKCVLRATWLCMLLR